MVGNHRRLTRLCAGVADNSDFPGGYRPECQQAQGQHLKTPPRIRHIGEIPPGIERHLVENLQVLAAKFAGKLTDTAGICLPGRHNLGHRLGHGDAVQHRQQLVEQRLEISAESRQLLDLGKQAGAIAANHRGQYPADRLAIDGAQHDRHVLLNDRAGAIPYSLVGETECISHTAVGGLSQQPQRRLIPLHGLLVQHMLQMGYDAISRHIFQVKLQAARQYGGRQLLGVGGRQQEFDVGRRLFQGLQ